MKSEAVGRSFSSSSSFRVKVAVERKTFVPIPCIWGVYRVYLGCMYGVYGVFRGVLGVYMVVCTCITGVHRCMHGYKGCIKGV